MRRHLVTIAAIGLAAMFGSGAWAIDDDQNAVDTNDPLTLNRALEQVGPAP